MSAVSQMALLGSKASSSLTTVQISPQSTTAGLAGVVYTIFDLTAAIGNGRTVASIGYYATSPETAKVKIGLRNSAGNFTIVADQSVSHPGGGWADFTLSSPYAVTGTAYYLAKANTGNTGTNDVTGTVARALLTGDQTGGPTGGYTENSSLAFPLRYSY
jgi:hypothetical protein